MGIPFTNSKHQYKRYRVVFDNHPAKRIYTDSHAYARTHNIY